MGNVVFHSAVCVLHGVSAVPPVSFINGEDTRVVEFALLLVVHTYLNSLLQDGSSINFESSHILQANIQDTVRDHRADNVTIMMDE